MLAIIGGSGLDTLPTLENGRDLAVETPFSRAPTRVRQGFLGGREALFLPRHGEDHAIPPHRVDYRANIRALTLAGATHVVAVCAVGGIRYHGVGSLCIPHQVVDYTSGREATFFDGGGAGVTHVDFTLPFDEPLRRRCLRAAKRLVIAIDDGGVYAAVNGPRLETAAEIDRFERDGATMIGMTGMPEAALAREDGLRYAMLALTVNHAAGRGDSEEGISEAALREVLASGMARVRMLLTAIAIESEDLA